MEDKIPDINTSAINTTLNAKTNEVKKEMPSITSIASTPARNAKVN